MSEKQKRLQEVRVLVAFVHGDQQYQPNDTPSFDAETVAALESQGRVDGNEMAVAYAKTEQRGTEKGEQVLE